MPTPGFAAPAPARTYSPPWYQQSWVPAAISAGASLLGGSMANQANKSAAKQNVALQREFAQHGIRWRVEDAKAAGLHPLYALGAQTPSFQPVVFQDSMGPAISEAGQNVARAVAATSTSGQRYAADLQLRLLESQLKESDARIGVLWSEAARNMQQANQSAPFPAWLNEDQANMAGFPQVQPGTPYDIRSDADVSLGRAGPYNMSTKEGASPFWSEFIVGPNNLRMVLPTTSNDPAEALETIGESWVVMVLTYQENRNRYGSEFADRIFHDYFGGKTLGNIKRSLSDFSIGTQKYRYFPFQR